MRRALLAALILGSIAAGCSRRSVVMADLPRDVSVRFQAGVTGYQSALEALGPPADGLPTQDGFALLYRGFEVAEANITLTYQGGKLSYSYGDRDNRALILFFDQGGVLQSVGRRQDSLDLGYGAVVGHTGVEEPFYEARQYDAISRRHYQAARLVRQAAALQRRLPDDGETDQRRNNERVGDEAETEGEEDD